MNAFAERLASGPCLLLDGGFGTLLMARGLASGTAPEAWNLDRPREVREAHFSNGGVFYWICRKV